MSGLALSGEQILRRGPVGGPARCREWQALANDDEATGIGSPLGWKSKSSCAGDRNTGAAGSRDRGKQRARHCLCKLGKGGRRNPLRHRRSPAPAPDRHHRNVLRKDRGWCGIAHLCRDIAGRSAVHPDRRPADRTTGAHAKLLHRHYPPGRRTSAARFDGRLRFLTIARIAVDFAGQGMTTRSAEHRMAARPPGRR